MICTTGKNKLDNRADYRHGGLRKIAERVGIVRKNESPRTSLKIRVRLSSVFGRRYCIVDPQTGFARSLVSRVKLWLFTPNVFQRELCVRSYTNVSRFKSVSFRTFAQNAQLCRRQKQRVALRRRVRMVVHVYVRRSKPDHVARAWCIDLYTC